MASATWYTVWKVKYNLSFPDPDTVGVRYHTVVFVETNHPAQGDGTIHHVTGDLVSAGGMHYESKLGRNPVTSQTFHSKEFLGHVNASDYPHRFDQVCRAQPAPPRQKAFNPVTGRHEPFKPDGTFYQPGEPRAPLFKCTEWTETRAIPALFHHNLIQTGTQQAQAAQSQASSSAQPEWDASAGKWKYWNGHQYQWM